MATLHVMEIFDSLQGEGYWTGVPMTFVRLSGCNAPALGLGCVRWCDTPESWDPRAGEELDIAEIMHRVNLPRLCLTGGEPLVQVDGVTKLVAEAHRLGRRVHLETNGTIDPPSGGLAGANGFDWAVVSPKPPDYRVSPGWGGHVDELKLVADRHLDAATAERTAARYPEAIICVQPEYPGAGATSPAQESIDRAISLVMAHPDWRLSVQMHKWLRIR